jgi:CubicO group peptidase (beta-lactamase class C family)
MKISLLILLICLFFHTSRGQTQTNDSLADAIGFIDAWLEAQQAYDHIPGISIGIVKDQQLIWSKGYGLSDIKKNIPVTPATVYSICSITKLFTSIAIMQLYEKGKLRLDDSLSALLPDFNIRQQFKESGPITIRSLLTHSSGLPRESDFPYWTGPDFEFPTRQQVADKLGKQQTLYPASTYFQYSNLGMAMLGEVIEKVSGQPYEAYVEENILKPLRLANTHPYLPAEQWGHKMAAGYSSIKRDGMREEIPLFDTKGITAAAGFSSTVEDLALFASWQFRLLKNGGKEILNAVTLKEMQRVHWVDPDWKIHWGLGFVVRQHHGKTLVGHAGSCPGYRTTLLIEPKEKFAYIVMMNAMGNPWMYASQVRNIILKAQNEKPVNSQSVDLTQYTGSYNAQPWGSEMKVITWYGNLAIVDFPSDSPLEHMALLQHIKGDVFRRVRRDETLGEEITFERDKKTGKVIRMWDHSNFSMKLK